MYMCNFVCKASLEQIKDNAQHGLLLLLDVGKLSLTMKRQEVKGHVQCLNCLQTF